MINIIKSDFLVNSNLSYSNSYCEILCLHIKSINLICITVYRPPNCPSNLFTEVIDKIEVWINSIENDGERPTIFINGDFNLPFMGTWDEESVTSLMESYNVRSNSGKSVNSDKIQAKSRRKNQTSLGPRTYYSTIGQ